LVQKSVSLQLDRHSDSRQFQNVNITADGKLTCRTRGGIEVKNADTLNTIKTVKDTNTTEWREIIQPEWVVVASCYNRNEGSTEVILLDSNTLQRTKSLYKSNISFFRKLQNFKQGRLNLFSFHGITQY